MRQYYTLSGVRFFNAPVSLHWSALLVIFIIIVSGHKEPLHALIAAVSYFSILILHEYGHGFVAHKLGYRVFKTKIGFIHGVCEFEEPYYEEHHIKIAWAGVLAQLIVAVPLIVLSQFKIFTDITYFGPVYAFLGYISLVIMLINLAPAKGLDGYIAWKAIPLLYRKFKDRTKNKDKKYKAVK